jgi:hypothetical protein
LLLLGERRTWANISTISFHSAQTGVELMTNTGLIQCPSDSVLFVVKPGNGYLHKCWESAVSAFLPLIHVNLLSTNFVGVCADFPHYSHNLIPDKSTQIKTRLETGTDFSHASFDLCILNASS